MTTSIGENTQEFSCPGCSTKFTTSLQNVADQKSVTCTGCGKNINLVDKEGTVRNAIGNIDRAFKRLRGSISKIPKIDIHL